MRILYLITKIITYPGAFLKGFWEHVTCRMLKLPVRSTQYLRSSDWCGHAEHDPANTPAKAWLMCFLPWLAQCVLGSIFLAASAIPLLLFGLRGTDQTQFFWLEIICLFLGLSIACNAFPQRGDAKRMWHLFYESPTEDEVKAMAARLAATRTSQPGSEDVCCNHMAIGEGTAEPVPSAPKFARLPARILFAIPNAICMAGAWLEGTGLAAILALGLTVALWFLHG
ncbi:MAG: hypothetical protein LBG83_03160 [Oscillospiraceae bacterium]|jgi:hypothetical protein|nr:hypothetical protein [Oscillospiraceae bacterium]